LIKFFIKYVLSLSGYKAHILIKFYHEYPENSSHLSKKEKECQEGKDNPRHSFS